MIENPISSSKNFKIGENQQVLRKDHDELIVKNCPKRKKQLYNSLVLNYHQIALVLNEIFGSNLIRFGIVKFVNVLAIFKNIV